MRISNINSNLAFNTVMARFAPNHGKRAVRYEPDGNVTLMVLDECDHCGDECEGANSVVLVKPAQFVMERLESLVRLGKLVKTEVYQESGCDDNGDCVCPSCYSEGLEEARRMGA